MSSNPGIISTLSSNPTNVQLVDGTDNIHSGIIKALHAATGENRAISGFNLTQTTSSGRTAFQVAAGIVLRNGKVISVTGGLLSTTTAQISANSVDWYGVIVVASDNSLAWRFGAVTGKANASTSTVAELATGDIPVIVVKIDSAEANNSTSRLHQYVGYTQTDREFSAIDNSVERLRINKGGTLTHIPSSTAYTLTLPSSTGTLALTSQVTNIGTSAISNDAITAAKLANNAVLTTNILDANVTTAKLADDSVTYSKIQNLSTGNRVLGATSAGLIGEVQVATDMISDGAITSAKINNGTIATTDIANDAITYAKIQNVSATNRILGRDSSGAGIVEEITPTNLLTMLGVEASADVTDTTNVRAALHNANLGTFSLGDTNDNISVGNLTIGGNLTISGSTTTVNSTTVNIGDSIITLNSDETGTPSEDAGIEVERGNQTNKTLFWDESASRWTVGNETFVAGTFIGDVTGTVSSAGVLSTARNFALTGDVTASAVSFNGSGDVSLSTSLSDGTITTSKIADSAVTAAKLTGNSVVNASIATNAVTTTKIADDAITTAKIADDAITSALIADDAIVSALIADDTITSALIADDAVLNSHLAGSIAQGKITGLTTALSGKQSTLTFGNALTNASGTVNVDIDSLSIETGIDLSNDYLMYDDATNGLRRINLSTIFSKLNASHIPNLSASKTTSGVFNISLIPDMSTSKITSGTFATARIANDAVTFDKIQNIGDTVILGRQTSGSGSIEALNASQARAVLGVDTAGTDNSTNVTLAGTRNYLTISGQTITRNVIDIGDDTNLVAGSRISLTGDTLNVDGDLAIYDNSNSGFLTAHPTISGAASSVNNDGRTYIQDITLDSNGHITAITSATETVTDTQYSVGDGGLTENNFTDTLKTKLDSVDSNSNYYTLPIATSSALGGFKVGSNLSINSITGVLSADTQSDVNFTSALNTKLSGIATNATVGANWATNVSNISVTNSQLAGSITNAKLANSTITLNGSSIALGGTATLTTSNIAEDSNLYFTDERVDDRVNALLTEGEGITTTYNDGGGALTISAEDATSSNKGIASFASADFDVSSGAVTVKSGGISNTQLAGSIANSKLLDIAQSKVTGLTSTLNTKVETLSDLSITASAAEINILDGVTGVSATEIGRLGGVTSAIQTQLNAKQASGNYLTTSASLTSLADVNEFDHDFSSISANHDSVPSTKAVKTYVDLISFDANDTQYAFSVEDTADVGTKKLKLTGTDGSFTSVNFEGSGAISVTRINERLLITSNQQAVNAANFANNTLTLTKTDGSTLTTTINTTSTASEVRALVESALDSNVFTDADHTKLNGISTSANNYSISSDLLDEDNMVSNSATKVASQQSIKAYVDTEVAGVIASAPAALDTLNELAAALGDDANYATTTSTALGNRLRVDVNSQGLNATQQANAITNLGITPSLAEINILDGGLSASDIPNLTASKVTSGTFTTARIPSLSASKITSGTFATARIADDAITVDKINGLTDLGSGTVISSSERTKLSGIETSADVTDATNVAAAGAVMDGDFSSNGFMKRTGAGSYTVDTNTYLTAHPNISAASSSNNSGRTYIQDITLDSNGHVTGIATATETVTNSDTQLTQEQVEDYVNGLIVAGTNVTKTYDDAAGTLTIASTGKTQEEIEDIVSSLVVAGSNITKTYDDSAGTLTISSINTNTQLTLLDEDNMATNSATAAASQQSIKAYVDAEVATNASAITAITNGAPTLLNTLDELAAALGDDANFSSTITTALGNRVRTDTASQGLNSTQKSNARTNIGVDVAGTDNSTNVTLASVSNNYLSISGQTITAGTIPLALGGTGATSASAARSNLGLGTAAILAGNGAIANGNAGLVTGDVVFDYITAQGFGSGNGDITSVVAGTGLSGGATSGDATLNVDAAQTQITSVGTLSNLTVSGDVTVDSTTFKIDTTNNRVGIGTSSPGYKLQVEGSFAAQTKSFVIPHPTQEGKTLQHGSLEGPEHGVYHRGRITGSDNMGVSIELPEYWEELVDEETITVQLTANGEFQMLYVEKIEDNRVFVGNAADEGVDCFYIIHGERKDVGKMEVEY